MDRTQVPSGPFLNQDACENLSHETILEEVQKKTAHLQKQDKVPFESVQISANLLQACIFLGNFGQCKLLKKKEDIGNLGKTKHVKIKRIFPF